ncbi:hypothetical protein GLA29479_499 [Lysobacter antibioticus]|uniref:hypothetical protein n=1 Tax=Lysobacter antibioticus TaxID=84531 RepID=UPI0007205FBA|nr:hypothetical protein [Lysobacter antibioticus]ALN61384.1 hypothetical protein GLA29479_499 [Lysobacter antibioticus]
MRIVALLVSVLGVLAFGGALVYSFVRPTAIESLARDLIRVEVEQRVGETLHTLDDSTVSRIATRMSERSRARIAQIGQQLQAGSPRSQRRCAIPTAPAATGSKPAPPRRCRCSASACWIRTRA